MATDAFVELTLRQKGLEEFKALIILTVYLWITLGAVILMKAAALHGVGISFVPWGIAIVKAAVLAKFLLIGRAMGASHQTGWTGVVAGLIEIFGKLDAEHIYKKARNFPRQDTKSETSKLNAPLPTSTGTMISRSRKVRRPSMLHFRTFVPSNPCRSCWRAGRCVC